MNSRDRCDSAAAVAASFRVLLVGLSPKYQAHVVQPQDEAEVISSRGRGRAVTEADDFGSGKTKSLRKGKIHRVKWQCEVPSLVSQVANQNCDFSTGIEYADAVADYHA